MNFAKTRRNTEQTMKALNEIPIDVRAVGITMTLAALVIALVAVAMTASPTMAQTPSYDPAPCGPGQKDVPDSPDAITSEGHYAVFDGYWDSKDKTLELNLCPPAVEHSKETRTNPVTQLPEEVEVSTRSSSNVDIRRTVFHINGSGFEHTLTAADVEKYDFFKVGDGPDEGTKDDAIGQTVWWLKVDDESTPNVDEDSALAMGYSAALFESQYWYREEDGVEVEPLQYEFEVIREPGIPVAEQGHVFAFDDSVPTDGSDKTADWDSSEVDANALKLYPDNYHHYQWAFTKPGTYEISVQLKGHVRKDAPADAGDDWEPISEKRVETSEVERYVFQIGPLTLNEEPIFEVMRSVEEHSAAGTPVGDPIPVHQGDEDDLTFVLSGPGHSLFSVEADANGNAQIKVAGNLDYEARSEYRLTMSVRDNKDHERNTDDDVDNSISVKINVTDVPLERSVSENLDGGVLVGDAIVVANATTSTVYTLSGDGSDLFSVHRDPSNNAEIKVPAGTALNYEDAWSYFLTLHADTDGTEDVRVVISVVDVPNERLAITLAASPSAATQNTGTSVVFTGTVISSPVPTSQLSYTWHEEDSGGGNATTTEISSPSQTVTEQKAGTRKYWMGVSYEGATPTTSDKIVITWQ